MFIELALLGLFEAIRFVLRVESNGFILENLKRAVYAIFSPPP